MKKIIALALAILMMAAIALPAMAEDDATEPVVSTNKADQANKTTSTNVTFGVTDRYTVTVPSEVAFGTDNRSTSTTIEATGVVIAANKKLEVKISSKNEVVDEELETTQWYMAPSDVVANEKVPYDVALENAETKLKNNDVVLTVLTGADAASSGSAKLMFTTEGTTQSGSYSDLLTFTTAVVDYTPAT